LQSRTWVGDDGQECSTTEVVAHEVIMLDRRTEAAPNVEAAEAPEPPPAARPATPPAAPPKRVALGRAARRRPATLEETDLPL
jgi:single-stranded DNA-binding protein